LPGVEAGGVAAPLGGGAAALAPPAAAVPTAGDMDLEEVEPLGEAGGREFVDEDWLSTVDELPFVVVADFSTSA